MGVRLFRGSVAYAARLPGLCRKSGRPDDGNGLGVQDNAAVWVASVDDGRWCNVIAVLSVT